MYLLINDNKYSCTKRVMTTDTIKYMGVEPNPLETEITGTIKMFRDDGFLMSEDAVDGFEMKSYTGTLLKFTNVPTPPAKEVKPSAEQILNIMLGVN